MGACPDWYVVIRAAKYMGVPPWDLIKQPMMWERWATWAMHAEESARVSQSDEAKKAAVAPYLQGR